MTPAGLCEAHLGRGSIGSQQISNAVSAKHIYGLAKQIHILADYIQGNGTGCLTKNVVEDRDAKVVIG